MQDTSKNYCFVGVLPYAYTANNELVFLLGQEWPGHTVDAYKWGAFGGGPELKDASLAAGAARECYEESMGFLGTPQEILQQIQHNNIVFTQSKAVTYAIPIPYNPELPALYQRVYDYTQNCSQNCPEGWFEKMQIGWWTVADILNNSNQIRSAFNTAFKEVILPRIEL